MTERLILYPYDVQLLLEHYGLRVVKTRNIQRNIGKSPEAVLAEALNALDLSRALEAELGGP